MLLQSKDKEAKAALNYLKSERNFSDELIQKFQIGWAPGGSGLSKKLSHAQELKVARELGIVFSKGNRNWDFFQSRLMIPIHDHRGRVVGFSGRHLGEVSSQFPKYKNSRESQVFKKKHILFGLNASYKLIREKNYVVLVEGFFDQWAFFNRDLPSAAVMGTAFTEEHVRLLKKHCSQVIIALDRDEAGKNSTIRSIPILLKNGIETKVFQNYAQKDPDEWLSNYSQNAEEALLRAPEALLWWGQEELRRSAKQGDNPIQSFNRLIPVWALSSSDAHRNFLSKNWAPLLNTDASVVERSLNDLLRKSSSSPHQSRDQLTGRASTQATDQLPTQTLSKRSMPEYYKLTPSLDALFQFFLKHFHRMDLNAEGRWEKIKKLFSQSEVFPFIEKMSEEWSKSSQKLQLEDTLAWVQTIGGLKAFESHIHRAKLEKSQNDKDGENDTNIDYLKGFEELSFRFLKDKVLRELKFKQNELGQLPPEGDESAQLLQEIFKLRMSLEKLQKSIKF